jgi:hypothetical protein
MRPSRAARTPHAPRRITCDSQANKLAEALLIGQKKLVLTCLIHALGWAGAPRCGETRLLRSPSAFPAGPWRVPVSGLAPPEFGVPLNPTNYLRRQIGFGTINPIGW